MEVLACIAAHRKELNLGQMREGAMTTVQVDRGLSTINRSHGPLGQQTRIFVVYEPGYHHGFLVTVGSLIRHASGRVAIDVLCRPAYVSDVGKQIDKLHSSVRERAVFNVIPMSSASLNECDSFRFRAHFKPEILFRLYYFDIVEDAAELTIYMDIDMIWRGDIFGLAAEYTGREPMAAMRDTIPDVSRELMPAGFDGYINSGLLLFRSERLSDIRRHLRGVREILHEIGHRSTYLDQDAISLAMRDKIFYINRKWNFVTKFVSQELESEAINLHATGSRKPWHFLGGHPYTDYYDEERKALGLSVRDSYDFFWSLSKALRWLKAYH